MSSGDEGRNDEYKERLIVSWVGLWIEIEWSPIIVERRPLDWLWQEIERVVLNADWLKRIRISSGWVLQVYN